MWGGGGRPDGALPDGLKPIVHQPSHVPTHCPVPVEAVVAVLVVARMSYVCAYAASFKMTHNNIENKYRGFGTVSPLIAMEFDSLGIKIQSFKGDVKVVLQVRDPIYLI